MALFDGTLADILGRKAETASMGITDEYARKKRKNAAIQAKSGRLGSGVANYQAGDLAAGELAELGGVQSSLADALAGIPAEDFLSTQQDNRNRYLAQLIGELSKPSDLEQAFGAIGGIGRIGSTVAGFM